MSGRAGVSRDRGACRHRSIIRSNRAAATCRQLSSAQAHYQHYVFYVNGSTEAVQSSPVHITQHNKAQDLTLMFYCTVQSAHQSTRLPFCSSLHCTAQDHCTALRSLMALVDRPGGRRVGFWFRVDACAPAIEARCTAARRDELLNVLHTSTLQVLLILVNERQCKVLANAQFVA